MTRSTYGKELKSWPTNRRAITFQRIVAADVAGWNSLEDIASSFKYRGIKPRPDMGEDYPLPLQLSDDEFIILALLKSYWFDIFPAETAVN